MWREYGNSMQTSIPLHPRADILCGDNAVRLSLTADLKILEEVFRQPAPNGASLKASVEVQVHHWPVLAPQSPMLALAACFSRALSFSMTTFRTSFTVKGTSVEYRSTSIFGRFFCGVHAGLTHLLIQEYLVQVCSLQQKPLHRADHLCHFKTQLVNNAEASLQNPCSWIP